MEWASRGQPLFQQQQRDEPLDEDSTEGEVEEVTPGTPLKPAKIDKQWQKEQEKAEREFRKQEEAKERQHKKEEKEKEKKAKEKERVNRKQKGGGQQACHIRGGSVSCSQEAGS